MASEGSNLLRLLWVGAMVLACADPGGCGGQQLCHGTQVASIRLQGPFAKPPGGDSGDSGVIGAQALLVWVTITDSEGLVNTATVEAWLFDDGELLLDHSTTHMPTMQCFSDSGELRFELSAADGSAVAGAPTIVVDLGAAQMELDRRVELWYGLYLDVDVTVFQT